MTDDEILALESFLKKKESNQSTQSLSDSDKLFDDMQAVGLFCPGSWDNLFVASEDNIQRTIDYNFSNIHMRKFVLEITQDCNYRCSYCPNTIEKRWRHHAKRHMSLHIAQKAIDLYYNLYTSFLSKVPEMYRIPFSKRYNPSIGFYGGEPTLNWKILMEGVDYYKSKDWGTWGIDKNELKLTVNTNLSFISNEMIEFLVENNATLFVSLDGPASEHDKCRVDVAGKPTFDRSYRNLMKIKEYNEDYFKKNVLLMAVEADKYDRDVTHEFLDALGCNISYLQMMHADCFIHNPVEGLRWLSENETQIIKNKVDKYFADPESAIADYTFASSLKTDIPNIGNIANSLPTCPVAADNIMIDVDGNFHICHKTDGSFSLGNIHSGYDYDQLRLFYSKLAERVNNPGCRKCWAFRMCGQCAAARLSGGDFLNPSADECRYIQKNAELRFKALIEIYRRDSDILDKIKNFAEDPDKVQGVLDLTKIEWEKL